MLRKRNTCDLDEVITAPPGGHLTTAACKVLDPAVIVYVKLKTEAGRFLQTFRSTDLFSCRWNAP